MFLVLKDAVQSAVAALAFTRKRRRRIVRQAIELAKRAVKEVKASVKTVRKACTSVTHKMQKSWAIKLTQEKMRKAKRMYRKGKIDKAELVEIITPLEQDLHELKKVRSIYSVSRRTPRDPVVKQAKATGGNMTRNSRHHSHKVYVPPEQRRANKLADKAPVHWFKRGAVCQVQVA